MKLFAYGDSWTEGVGGNINEKKQLKSQKKEQL